MRRRSTGTGRKITIADIARMADVSTAAVSFVLNGKPGVSGATRKRVLAIIEKTRFRPSLKSRRLSLNKNFSLCVALRPRSSPFRNLFYVEVIDGVLDACRQAGYGMLLTYLQEGGGPAGVPEVVHHRDTDGVLFLEDVDQRVYARMRDYEVPFVVVDAHVRAPSFLWVAPDYEVSAFTATRHLVEAGHNRIAFIGSAAIPEYFLQCKAGFSRALARLAPHVPAHWVRRVPTDDDGPDGMTAILSAGPAPTAVFCSSDQIAIGAMKCARERGLRVPADMSFIGIDDILLSQHVEPPLTTIRIDKREMGTLGARLLLDAIEGRRPESVMTASATLVARGSVGRPPG